MEQQHNPTPPEGPCDTFLRLDGGEEWSAVLEECRGMVKEKDWEDFNPEAYQYAQLDAVLAELRDPSGP